MGEGAHMHSRVFVAAAVYAFGNEPLACATCDVNRQRPVHDAALRIVASLRKTLNLSCSLCRRPLPRLQVSLTLKIE